MALKFGITGRLLVWLSTFVLIFYGTILILFLNIQQIVKITENIVSNNFEVSSVSKKMMENLFSMEESEKKYHLLKKDIYIQNFMAAQKEFTANLNKILALYPDDTGTPVEWRELNTSYRRYAIDLNALEGNNVPAKQWIPEKVINDWINRISRTRTENEEKIEAATRELNRHGQKSARNGLVGLGLSGVVGLLGILFLSSSMVRPLKDLLKGIRSVSKDQFNTPLRIRSQDEFGELARAFNEMTTQLKEEEQMRSDFISMLSHEIRTPLTSIRESVNMIVEEVMGAINERQRKFLEIASMEIGRICNLLNHLMQVSRLESGSLQIQKRLIDTASFVSGCIRHLNHVAEAKDIIITVQIPPNVPNITGDPEHLQRVFLNLLDNAIKFSVQGSRIDVAVKLSKNRKDLIFSVADSGPGIPKDEQVLIFNKYYQARGARDHMDGVGLGLNISKHIVKAHEGEINVESEVGKGSVFYFQLPATGGADGKH